MTMKRYGWRKDTPDFRDHMMQLAEAPMLLPPIVDLRPQCSPVLDQGQLGSCVAHATRSAIDFEVKKRGLPLLTPSRLFIYYLAREIEGSIQTDSGCEIRDAMKAIGRIGVAPEAIWPYLITNFSQSPPSTCYAAATKHIAHQYYSVAQDLNQMKSCLAAGFPFIFGFTVYSSFESQQVSTAGIVPMPSTMQSVLGGHAVLAVGFNDTTRRFYVQNSWGTAWGLNGFFEIPYDYLLNPNLASDFWTVRLVDDMQEGPITVIMPVVSHPQPENENTAAVVGHPVETIKQEVDEIKQDVEGLLLTIGRLRHEVSDSFNCLNSVLAKDVANLSRNYSVVVGVLTAIVDMINADTAIDKQILDLLTTSSEAVALKIRLKQSTGETMEHPHAAGIDFQFFENGQATATVTPVDASGNPTNLPAGTSVPAFTISDPSITVSPSADGLSALLTAGPVAVTAATLTVTATLPDGATVITGTSDPIDVVAQAPGSPVAFKIGLS